MLDVRELHVVKSLVHICVLISLHLPGLRVALTFELRTRGE